MADNYNVSKNKIYTLKLREILKELPSFCGDYFRGIENNTSILTRYGYATDLKIFFNFLVNEIAEFRNKKVIDITLDDLAELKVVHFEIFLNYVTLYENSDNEELMNNDRAKARKLSTLRSFFKYFYSKELLPNNVPALVRQPKLHEKPILRLEPNEVADLLDLVQDGDKLTEKQKKYHQLTNSRDLAILTLFLGTGIRISELVGIDIDDINFETNQFSIIRKGGNTDILMFGDEVRTALLNYMVDREKIIPCDGHENALFLSMQRKRMSVRSIENLVKKYASIVIPQKNISPHKLRSTYGTMLYNETSDIYLVADVLGQKDVNTTRKYYVPVSEDRRKIAARTIKLRDNENTDN